jgi:hypothetical protein
MYIRKHTYRLTDEERNFLSYVKRKELEDIAPRVNSWISERRAVEIHEMEQLRKCFEYVVEKHSYDKKGKELLSEHIQLMKDLGLKK